MLFWAINASTTFIKTPILFLGFTSTSYDFYSIIVYSICLYVVFCGVIFLVKNQLKYFELSKFLNSLYISKNHKLQPTYELSKSRYALAILCADTKSSKDELTAYLSKLYKAENKINTQLIQYQKNITNNFTPIQKLEFYLLFRELPEFHDRF